MIKLFKKALQILAISAALIGTEAKATTFATSCNSSDVQSAISLAGAGGTVLVPAGTCSWSSVSFSGVQVIGAGKTSSGTVITSGEAVLTKHSTFTTRLSGFNFTGTDTHASVSGSPTARAYIIDNNHFNGVSNNFIDLSANGGLLYGNDFFNPPSSAGAPDVFAIHPNESWSQPTTFGTADTQGPTGGERNIYIEDNTFTNVLETAPDADQGARVVIRHNTYIDSSIVFHSGAPNDTSLDGTRQFEIYSNVFHRVTSSDNMNKWIWVRGGSGVIANNSFDSINSPDFGGKVDVKFGVGCPVAYPVPHQIGQTSATPQNPPPQPLLIFGNTGAGTSDANWLVIAANDTGTGGGTGCSNPGAFVQAGRDYMTSNTWGWAAFAYPHPLRTGVPPPPPPPPAPANPVASGSLLAGTVGSSYSSSLVVTGGTAPYVWSVVPALPSPLSLNVSTGVVTGTPSAIANVNETFTVTDSASLSSSISSQLVITAASAFTPVRIKAGAAFTDSQHNVWTTDSICVGGSSITRTNAIIGALPSSSDGPLYQSERYNNPTCTIPAPAGNYTVTVKESENFFSTAGHRKFNIVINGVTVVSNYDPFAGCSSEFRACDLTFNIANSGNSIAISFVNVLDNAKYDAIQIVSSGTAPPPPPPPPPTLTESCVNMATARVCTYTETGQPGVSLTSTGTAGGIIVTNTGNIP